MKQPTVHVVEDNPAARISLAALVNAIGFETQTYESAEHFLAQLEAESGGCLITDLRLGGMSGIDLQRRMAERGSTVPVILITAYAEVSLVEKAIAEGAIRVLEKPCQAAELEAAIKAALAVNPAIKDDPAVE